MMNATMNKNEMRLEKLREILKRAVNLKVGDENSGTLMHEDLLEKLKNVWLELNGIAKDEKCSSVPSMEEFLAELKILESTSSVLGKCIHEFQITGGRNFISADYATKLLSKLSNNDGIIDWMMLAGDANRIINRAPGVPILVGTIDASRVAMPSEKNGRKKQKVSRRDIEQEKAKKEVPDTIESMEMDENSVDRKVENIMKLLQNYCHENNNNPISFYKFVLHPSNFTSTIENIFHLSFIIRDGLARLDTIDDEIVIAPENESKKSAVSAGRAAECSKYQMVFSISFDEWKNLVKAYALEKPLIK